MVQPNSFEISHVFGRSLKGFTLLPCSVKAILERLSHDVNYLTVYVKSYAHRNSIILRGWTYCFKPIRQSLDAWPLPSKIHRQSISRRLQATNTFDTDRYPLNVQC